ncbi:MAG TPA: hypothetical protein VMR14_12095 [Streptosporangiaceae bacterium]|nr:hypothetical protein [Streptosporangiaceae bacterium]
MTSGGFSPRRLTRVRDVLSRHLDAGYVPGAVAVVARHGEVHVEAMGNLAFDGEGSGTPMAADTICRYPPWRAGALAAVGDADDHRPPDASAEGSLPILFDFWTAAYQAIDD